MAYVDYRELKKAVSMTAILEWLGITLKPEGKTFRGECPFCHKGGDRAFVATPSEHLYFCHHEGYGKDTLDLVARMHNLSTREAAIEIAEHFGFGTVKSTAHAETSSTTSSKSRQQSGELKPLEHLKFDHEVLDALGIPKAVAEAIGVGVPSKGVIRNRLAIPIRLSDGTLLGYFGLAISAEQMPLLWLPDNLAEMLNAPVPQKEEKQASSVHQFLRVVK